MKHVLMLVITALNVFPRGGFTQDNDVVYAVGDNSTLLRLVGPTDWAAVPVDSIPGCGDLLSVWGSSDRDIYVAGCYDDLLHFDGTRWHKIAMANPSVRITAVSGTGPDNIYAGGSYPVQVIMGYHITTTASAGARFRGEATYSRCGPTPGVDSTRSANFTTTWTGIGISG